MIKFRAAVNDRQIFGFGLSEENIKRLKKGQPIHIFLQEMGQDLPYNFEIVILYGTTEEEITKDLVDAGLVLQRKSLRF